MRQATIAQFQSACRLPYKQRMPHLRLKGRYRELALLTCAVLVTRYVFRSKLLYDIDSVNFALGMAHFNPAAHQPHPPGYFLYIWFGGLLQHWLRDANTALVAISIAASCGTVWAIYQLTAEWFGVRAARWAGLLFLFSPLAWFHGTVALTYIVEAFFSALLGYLFWRMRFGGAMVMPAVLFGLAAGVRPSGVMFLGPLFLYALAGRNAKARVGALAIFLVTVLLWAFPMMQASGGWAAYSGALWALWKIVPAQQTVANSSIFNSLVRAVTIAYIFVLSFGAAGVASALAALARFSRGAKPHVLPAVSQAGRRRFLAVWLLPGLLFFTFVFLRFANSGYLLILFPPLCACLGFQISQWYERSRISRPVKLSVAAAAAACNIVLFLAAPLYCSNRGVREFEAEIAQIRTELPQAAPAAETLLVGFDTHILGYRHAGYYLDRYVTVQYPEVAVASGIRTFSMQGRETSLARDLETGKYRKFVFFPLPQEPEFAAYLLRLRAKLPEQDRQTVRLGHHDYQSWPIEDLALLFPTTACPPGAACMHGVSSARSVNNR